jgi:ferredoxin
MSAFIGGVRGPQHNSPHEAADVWCSPGGIELRAFTGNSDTRRSTRDGVRRLLDPIAARNLAALLVRASEEVERMRARQEPIAAAQSQQPAPLAVQGPPGVPCRSCGYCEWSCPHNRSIDHRVDTT